jgi:FixJ family two-component response regulator
MTESQEIPVVYVVDDESSMLEVIPELLGELDVQVKTYQTGEALLKETSFAHRGCFLLDNVMPGQSGLEIQEVLNERAVYLPCVFMSGHSEYDDVVQAVQHGAIAFLQKPFTKDQLVETVRSAIAKCNHLLSHSNESIEFREKIASLTRRERDVYNMMRKGFSTKRSAQELDITPSTVEFHRTNVLKKTGFAAISELLAFELRLKSLKCTECE